jgi:hypothetical protein
MIGLMALACRPAFLAARMMPEATNVLPISVPVLVTKYAFIQPH